MPRVAVLGATGGVGRYVCQEFAGRGYDVLAVARNFAPHVADYKFVALDVGRAAPAELADLLTTTGADVVVNATGGWATDEEEMRYAHVHLVRRLTDAVALVPGRPRLVQLGSIHEYGRVPDGTAIDEAVRPDPATAYARTKLAGSEAVLAATRAGAVDGVVLRIVNVCGPHSTAASFLGAVVQRLGLSVPGQSLDLTIADARRDFVDVRDAAVAVALAAEAPVTGRVFNIGRGEAVSMRGLVLLLVAAAGFPPDAVTGHADHVDSKGGGWTQADISLARRLLHWTPVISLPDSMRAMWEASVKELPV